MVQYRARKQAAGSATNRLLTRAVLYRRPKPAVLREPQPIITPEWLVILKYIAGRMKDQQDAVYLLKQKGLVDRRLLRRKIVETAGREYWALVAAGLQRWYDLADGRIRTEKEDYEAGRM